MYSKKFLILLLIALSAILGWQCSSALYKPLETNIPQGSSLADLQKGRALYISKCGGCHMLYLPQDYPEHKWVENVDEMKDEAQITQDESDLILKYILSSPKKQTSN